MKNNSSLFPTLSDERRMQMLSVPRGKIKAVLDTDTFNEIDDQFALSMAILLSEKMDMQAITAAPFLNYKVSTPGEGMEKSYQEILRILELLDCRRENFVFRGSEHYLTDSATPVDTPAARRIVELAKEASAAGDILYVLAIGAITNVASALLMAPEIINNVVIVWLGGHNLHTAINNEFNLRQDIPAAQVVFDSGVPLVWIPCRGVAELLMTSLGEIERRTVDCGKIGHFLCERAKAHLKNDPGALKVIWDISTVLYFARPDLLTARLIPAPVLHSDTTWEESTGRHLIKHITYIDRVQCFNFLYDILAKAPK